MKKKVFGVLVLLQTVACSIGCVLPVDQSASLLEESGVHTQGQAAAASLYHTKEI